MTKTIHPALAEHAMEENQKLRGLLGRCVIRFRDYLNDDVDEEDVSAIERLMQDSMSALSQQAEPFCVACEDRPAPCNDPCALCGKQEEPAPAQDERASFESHFAGKANFERNKHHPRLYLHLPTRAMWDAWQARATRPAQTAPRPEQSELVKTLPYQTLFNAIAAATKSVPGTSHVSVSVEAFRAALAAQGGSR